MIYSTLNRDLRWITPYRAFLTSLLSSRHMYTNRRMSKPKKTITVPEYILDFFAELVTAYYLHGNHNFIVLHLHVNTATLDVAVFLHRWLQKTTTDILFFNLGKQSVVNLTTQGSSLDICHIILHVA